MQVDGNLDRRLGVKDAALRDLVVGFDGFIEAAGGLEDVAEQQIAGGEVLAQHKSKLGIDKSRIDRLLIVQPARNGKHGFGNAVPGIGDEAARPLGLLKVGEDSGDGWLIVVADEILAIKLLGFGLLAVAVKEIAIRQDDAVG